MSEDDKVQLKIWVSKRTDKRVRAYIAQKYNMHVKGLLSFEGEQLLIDGLDSKDKRGKGNFYETKAHTHTRWYQSMQYERSKGGATNRCNIDMVHERI